MNHEVLVKELKDGSFIGYLCLRDGKRSQIVAAFIGDSCEALHSRCIRARANHLIYGQ